MQIVLTVGTWLARLPDSVLRWRWSAQSGWRWCLASGGQCWYFFGSILYLLNVQCCPHPRATSHLKILQPPQLTITVHKPPCCHHPSLPQIFLQPPQFTITFHEPCCCYHPPFSSDKFYIRLKSVPPTPSHLCSLCKNSLSASSALPPSLLWKLFCARRALQLMWV